MNHLRAIPSRNPEAQPDARMLEDGAYLGRHELAFHKEAGGRSAVAAATVKFRIRCIPTPAEGSFF
jgi:hypothetical protein